MIKPNCKTMTKSTCKRLLLLPTYSTAVYILIISTFHIMSTHISFNPKNDTDEYDDTILTPPPPVNIFSGRFREGDEVGMKMINDGTVELSLPDDRSREEWLKRKGFRLFDDDEDDEKCDHDGVDGDVVIYESSGAARIDKDQFILNDRPKKKTNKITPSTVQLSSLSSCSSRVSPSTEHHSGVHELDPNNQHHPSSSLSLSSTKTSTVTHAPSQTFIGRPKRIVPSLPGRKKAYGPSLDLLRHRTQQLVSNEVNSLWTDCENQEEIFDGNDDDGRLVQGSDDDQIHTFDPEDNSEHIDGHISKDCHTVVAVTVMEPHKLANDDNDDNDSNDNDTRNENINDDVDDVDENIVVHAHKKRKSRHNTSIMTTLQGVMRYGGPHSVSTRFDDIIGHKVVKQRLNEVLLPLALPHELIQSVLTGIRSLSPSVLMFGPPGCGKVIWNC